METIEGSTPPEHGDFMVESQPSGDTSLIDRFPYASRLGTNDVPSDDETEEIKLFLREPTEQVQQMGAEIYSLQARLDFLRPRYAALKSQVATCRSLITIPRRLPEDILLEIFFHCLPETGNSTMDSTAAPLLLTVICRRWRILVLQTPTLWSAMHISIEDVDKKRSMGQQKINALREASQQHLYSMLSKWLERSGTCPLTFSLCLDVYQFRSNPYERTLYTKCLQILLPFISRWKNVFLVGKIECLSPVLTMPHAEFQSLESLFLDLNGDPLPHAFPMFNAPCLRKVSIQNKVIDSTTLALPWARLTHLDLGGAIIRTAPSITTLSTVLGLCASLIYLGLDIYHGEDIKPMFLPNLRRICIRQHVASRDSQVPKLFSENLKAPFLRKISLRNFDDDSFPVFLSKHGQSIRSLDFNTQYIHFPAFAKALRHCPSLESLSLIRLHGDRNHFKINREFFSLLSPSDRNDTGPLCPLLQELIFDSISCDTLTGLASFIEAKQNAHTRVLSRLVRISTDFIREGEKCDSLPEEMVKQALKPFTDTNLLFEMWQGRRPYSYGMSKDRYFGHGSLFQYADCWKD